MNLSLKRRVAICFVIANVCVIALHFTVFNYLDSLKRDVGTLMDQSSTISFVTDAARLDVVKILKNQRRLVSSQNSSEAIEDMIESCDDFVEQLQKLDSFYTNPEIKKVMATMEGYANSLKIILSKSTFIRGSSGFGPLIDLSDKILESFTEFQNMQNDMVKTRDDNIADIIRDTKRRMMITLIIGFLGTILLALVVPGKIALPFKKINDAIRELQDCNFDVSIFYNQEDEIGEIAREMNKMIGNMKRFEELRADRIGVELRKFDALSNMIKKPVLVANDAGKLIYMNNPLYEILQVQSDEILSKKMNENIIPKTIIEAYELAIKRRSKIENQEILIPRRNSGEEEQEGEEAEKEMAFRGYANVIPIRGKESSLDYYLMVMSEDVIV